MIPWMLTLALVSGPAEEASLKQALAKPIIGPRQALLDVQEHLEPRIVRMPTVTSAKDWQVIAERLRADLLARVVLRGKAAGWAARPGRVEFLDETLTGKGYTIRKLRYEAVPGLWIPALLYVPDRMPEKTPVMLAVNGHDRIGKAAEYKQARCINLARRGMLVLNVEWFGMGQLRVPGNQHGAMNQMDLCGTSGLAPFYLAMTRGLDVLLDQPNADPARVAVSGLSGGGWQTIFVSALDPRVTLANPVAGYSGMRIRLRDHAKDLGDSEQTPVDLATIADYTHLTALRAPRPTLLTYNAKDDCCFEAGYALPPLLEAARPIYRLFEKERALRWHVNHDPGTHNFDRENREALYRMIGDFFYPTDKTFDSREIPCQKEYRSATELHVPVPADSATLNTLARDLARDLPSSEKLTRARLAAVVRAPTLAVEANEVGRQAIGDTSVIFWKLRLGKTWTLPVVELTRGKTTGTVILLNEGGRAADTVNVQRLLGEGKRVLAVDLLHFGEAKMDARGWLYALVVSCVGERLLGIQSGQLLGVARWSAETHRQPVAVTAIGPRVSLIALIAAALEERPILALQLEGCRKSLKELIVENRTVDQMPEMFCFGLLEVCDLPQLIELIAPRPVVQRTGKGR